MSYGQGGWGGGQGPPGYGPPPAGYGPPQHHGPPPEPPLTRIPFTPEDEANLLGMARYAKVAAIALVVTLVIEGIALVLKVIALAFHHVDANVRGPFFGGALGFIIVALLFWSLWRAATAIEKVVKTDEADQHYLTEGLRALRDYFLVKGIVYILALIGCLCLALVIAVLGAFVFALLGAAQS